MINKIVIIEDEKLNADRLKRLIGTLRPKASILAVLDSVTDTISWFEKNSMPDLIMMDIRLSDGLSFEIFDKIQINCPIIFTTAYDEYAVRAFKYNSIDYLLKPVEQEELESALKKVELQMPMANNSQSIEGLLDFLRPKEFRTRFLLPFRDGYRTILVNDIMYFYLELKITKARLFDGTEVVLSQTMEELEQQLDPKFFFRANRQFIVYIDAIQQIHNYFNGKLKVGLKNNDTEIIVSRDKSNALKAWMDF